MASKKSADDGGKIGGHDVAELERRLTAGEQPPAGVCIDYDRKPHFYACSDEDAAVARGEVSRSADGALVTDTATGEVTAREPFHLIAEMAPADRPGVPGGLQSVPNTPATNAGA